MTLIATKGDDIKYVAVEVLMKDAVETAQVWEDQKDKVTYGLLKGLEDKKGIGKVHETFILVSGPDKVSRICNLDVYNILSFEIYDGLERDITFFRSCEEDQEAALQMTTETIALLKEAKKTIGESALIDVSKFTELPKDFIGEKKSTVTTPSMYSSGKGYPGSGVAQQPATHHVPYTNAYNHTTYVAPKEKEPTTFKRTSRKPTRLFLDKMRESVLAIQAGSYEPKIPVIKKDAEEEADKEEGHTRVIYPGFEDSGEFSGCC